jgi:four helix bundle protein
MLPYERLAAWRKSHQLVLLTYRLTSKWPKQEIYGLTAQARRAVVSVPLNIAEGSARKGSRELRRFLDIALGSLSELAYSFHLARDLSYSDAQDWQDFNALRDDAGQLIWKLYRAVAKNVREASQ